MNKKEVIGIIAAWVKSIIEYDVVPKEKIVKEWYDIIKNNNDYDLSKFVFSQEIIDDIVKKITELMKPEDNVYFDIAKEYFDEKIKILGDEEEVRSYFERDIFVNDIDSFESISIYYDDFYIHVMDYFDFFKIKKGVRENE